MSHVPTSKLFAQWTAEPLPSSGVAVTYLVSQTKLARAPRAGAQRPDYRATTFTALRAPSRAASRRLKVCRGQPTIQALIREHGELHVKPETRAAPPDPVNPSETALYSSGARRARTADPLLAKQVLSQLSYGPTILYFNDLASGRPFCVSKLCPTNSAPSSEAAGQPRTRFAIDDREPSCPAQPEGRGGII